MSLFVLLWVLWLHVRAVVLGQVHAVPVERQSEMSASVPGRSRSVAEPNRWGRWHRWASTGKGDVASVSTQRASLPSWATSCFPLLSPMGHPAESSSMPQPAAATCTVSRIVRNADVRQEEELLAQASQALCHTVLCRSSFGGCLGVDLQGRGMGMRYGPWWWLCAVLSAFAAHTCSHGEQSFLFPSLKDGLMYITGIQRMMLGTSSVCRSC